MFIGGASLMPKISTTVALSYAYAAYETRSRGGDWTGFLVAAGLLVSIVPFTLLVMSSTNTALINSAKGSSSLAQGQVSELIKKWAVLNLTRSLLPLAAAATGFVTFLKNVS